MAVQVEFLKNTPYFSGLAPEEFSAISKLFFEKIAIRGETVLLEGEASDFLYFVVSGVVKVFKTSADGNEQILSLIRPGESFNDVPVFPGGQSLASAEAMGDVVLYGIAKRELESFVQDHTQLALSIINILSQWVQRMVALVEDLSFRPVTGRVAKILLEHAGNGVEHSPRLTQQEMAAMAGTAREMVGRSLKVLEDEGTIRFDHHRIIITDREALRSMAGMVT